MKINHIIIGTLPQEKSLGDAVLFYIEVLGLKEMDRFLDTGTGEQGRVLVHESNGKENFEILLVPFKPERLPNPQHVAIEVNAEEFQSIYARAVKKKLTIRSESALDSTLRGIGEFKNRGIGYERFYLLDPSGVNIEIMNRLSI